jgi:hypothetical protein
LLLFELPCSDNATYQNRRPSHPAAHILLPGVTTNDAMDDLSGFDRALGDCMGRVSHNRLVHSPVACGRLGDTHYPADAWEKTGSVIETSFAHARDRLRSIRPARD